MPRIIAGSAKGATLKVPKSARPTSDRVREALFSILEHRGFVEDCQILDVCAGSGAFALEALSRGARSAVAIDLAREAIMAMKDNAKKTDLDLHVVSSKAETWLAQADAQFDLIFIDPPYQIGEQAITTMVTLAADLLVDDGLMVIERDSRSPEPSWPESVTAEKPRQWGDTTMWCAQRD